MSDFRERLQATARKLEAGQGEPPQPEAPPSVAAPKADFRARLQATARQLNEDAGQPTGASRVGVGFAQGFMGMAESALDSAATLAATLDPRRSPYTTPQPEATLLGRASRAVAGASLDMGQSAGDSFLLDTVPKALGSATAFLASGLAGRALKIGSLGVTMTLGAAANASQGYYEALLAGKGEDVAWRSFVLNAGVGTSEALPIERILNRINTASGGTLKRFLVDRLIDGATEGAQEPAQQAASNLIAQHLYDGERQVIEGLVEGGAAGTLTGILLGALTSSVGMAADRARLAREDAAGPTPLEPVERDVPTREGPGYEQVEDEALGPVDVGARFNDRLGVHQEQVGANEQAQIEGYQRQPVEALLEERAGPMQAGAGEAQLLLGEGIAGELGVGDTGEFSQSFVSAALNDARERGVLPPASGPGVPVGDVAAAPKRTIGDVQALTGMSRMAAARTIESGLAPDPSIPLEEQVGQPAAKPKRKKAATPFAPAAPANPGPAAPSKPAGGAGHVAAQPVPASKSGLRADTLAKAAVEASAVELASESIRIARVRAAGVSDADARRLLESARINTGPHGAGGFKAVEADAQSVIDSREAARPAPKAKSEAPEPRLAQDLIGIVASARATQTRFLESKGLTWEQVRALPAAERPQLQEEYSAWLKAQEAATPEAGQAPPGPEAVVEPAGGAELDATPAGPTSHGETVEAVMPDQIGALNGMPVLLRDGKFWILERSGELESWPVPNSQDRTRLARFIDDMETAEGFVPTADFAPKVAERRAFVAEQREQARAKAAAEQAERTRVERVREENRARVTDRIRATTWRKGRIELAPADGDTPAIVLEGPSDGTFLIHSVRVGRQTVYYVSHVPTKRRVTISGKEFPTQALAKAYAARLHELGDWSSSDPDAIAAAMPKNMRDVLVALAEDPFADIPKAPEPAPKAKPKARKKARPAREAPGATTSFGAGVPFVDLSAQTGQAAAKARAAAKEWLTKEGNLPGAVFQSNVAREGYVSEMEVQSQQIARRFKAATKGLTAEDMEGLNGALQGEVPLDALPEKLRGPVSEMRAHVDDLSRELIRSGAVDGKLVATIEKNLGTYLTRSYRVFDDPEWAKKVPEQVRNRAKSFLRSQYEGASDEDIDGIIENLLYEGKAAQGPLSLIAHGKLGSKDLSVLKRRTGIPREIRALFGEHTDPMVNYTRSVARMAHLIASHRFLAQARDSGLSQGFFTDKPTVENKVRIAADASSVMHPLNGLFTSPEIERAFREVMDPTQAGPWLKLWMKANFLAKAAKTVGSVVTAQRNIVGNVGFAIANAHTDIFKAGPAMRAVKADITGGDERAEAYIRKLARLGLIRQDVRSSELRDSLRDAIGKDADAWMDAHISKAILLPWRAATTYYRLGDEVWKVYAFENEVARQAAARPQMPREQVEELAAEIVRDTYPTYSHVSKGVKMLRRMPLLGPFVSFPAEVVRTAKNSLRLAHREISDANPAVRAIGYRRAAGLAAAALLADIAAITSAYLLGMDRDDEENARQFFPEWSKNSSILWWGRSKDGHPIWIDLSYSDPWSYIKEPVHALLLGRDPLEAAIEPFVGEELFTSKIIDVMRNRQQNGAPVYTDTASPEERAAAVAGHVLEAFKPGTLELLQRMKWGLEGRVSGSGREYNATVEAISAFTGLKPNELNVRQALDFKARNYLRDLSETSGVLNSVLRNRGTVDEAEIVEAWHRAQGARRRVFEEMHEAVMAARALGLSERDAKQILQGPLSVEAAKGLLAGEHREYLPGKTFWNALALPGAEVRRRRKIVESLRKNTTDG